MRDWTGDGLQPTCPQNFPIFGPAVPLLLLLLLLLSKHSNPKDKNKTPTTLPLIASQSKQKKSTPAVSRLVAASRLAVLFIFLGPRDCLPISAGRSPGLPAPGRWHLADPALQTRPVRLVCETSSQALLAAAPPQAQRPVSRLHFWHFPLLSATQQQEMV